VSKQAFSTFGIVGIAESLASDSEVTDWHCSSLIISVSAPISSRLWRSELGLSPLTVNLGTALVSGHRLWARRWAAILLLRLRSQSIIHISYITDMLW